MAAPPLVVRPPRRPTALVRWGVTIGATVVSTWALDLVATAVGVLLVASGVLADAPRPLVLVLLVASYAAWGAGLRVNLRANWRLLEATGTSTNALSKLGFDLVGRRAATDRRRRVAAATGYVITELAKEAPYYVGAFGAALLSEGVDATDALVFLAGANLGAALYEFGLASLTAAVLGSRSRPDAAPAYASFDDEWVPEQYLADYYRSVEPDEEATIAFFVDAYRRATAGEPVLVFGVGPTLHHVFLTAAAASEIHLADYLPANLAEIRRWLDADAGAHDWRPFVRQTLLDEGLVEPGAADVAARERLTRARVRALLPADARLPQPLGGGGCPPYGTVISGYCADSATADVATWETYVRHIAGLVRPGGLFITAALRRSTGYTVGDRTFPSACIDERDLRRVLAPDFDVDGGVIEVVHLRSQPWHGYASIVLACVRRW